jgi:MraZ protein
MLFGRFDNSIDEYNRMFMPSKYCEDFDVRSLSPTGNIGSIENQNFVENNGAINFGTDGEQGNRGAKSGKLRKNYEGRCVIVHGVDKCLYAFTIKGFEEFIKDLESLPEDDEKIRDLLRHYYTTANYCDIDKQGRVTIPPLAREYAGIVRDLATVGMNNKVEIWDRGTYEEAVSGINAKDLSNYASRLKSQLRGNKIQ